MLDHIALDAASENCDISSDVAVAELPGNFHEIGVHSENWIGAPDVDHKV